MLTLSLRVRRCCGSRKCPLCLRRFVAKREHDVLSYKHPLSKWVPAASPTPCPTPANVLRQRVCQCLLRAWLGGGGALAICHSVTDGADAQSVVVQRMFVMDKIRAQKLLKMRALQAAAAALAVVAFICAGHRASQAVPETQDSERRAASSVCPAVPQP